MDKLIYGSRRSHLSSIIPFLLGLNPPRSALLATLAVIAASILSILSNSRNKPHTLSETLKNSLRTAYQGQDGRPALASLICLLIFGCLVTVSSFMRQTPRLAIEASEYLLIFPFCISLAASNLNQRSPKNTSRLAIAYSVGSLIYVGSCLLNSRLQADFNLASLFFRQSHNELIAPWGHLNSAVNLRTVEQSLLFPICLLPVSVVGLIKSKERKNWIAPTAIGIAAIALARGFGSHFPLIVLATSSGLGIFSVIVNQRYAWQRLRQRNIIPISLAVSAAALPAISYLSIKKCILVDERFSRAVAALGHLPFLPPSGADVKFSYQEMCSNESVTFIWSSGNSLHNVFLDYSLSSGLVAGIALFSIALFFAISFFSRYSCHLIHNESKYSEETFELGITASTILTIWIIYLLQPVSSSNFSMFILSLYYLSVSSSLLLSKSKELEADKKG